MKKINLSITGCLGRMGRQLIKSTKSAKYFKLVSITENKIINRATLAIILCSSFPMLIVGCYFVHIPWNMQRLNLTESDLGLAILVFGIFF